MGTRQDGPSPPAVQVWWAPLQLSPTERSLMWSHLRAEERRRADSYRSAVHRDRFIAARGWLRELLGAELGCPPEAIVLVSQAGTKPQVADRSVHFSATRSADVAMFATSWSIEVGVDVEAKRPVADPELVSARFFSAAEHKALLALPNAERSAALMACWTRKEAYLKGTGQGIGVPLDDVEVWAGGRGPCTVNGWTVCEVQTLSGYCAALAGHTTQEWALIPARRLRWSPKSKEAPSSIERRGRHVSLEKVGRFSGGSRAQMDDIAQGSTVVALIVQAANEAPGNLAVHAADGTLSYADLVSRAETVAAELRGLGTEPGDLVGLCVERSSNLVVGALGILLAGGAYVAIDPRYPDERIAWMLNDSDALAVVCDENTEGRIGVDPERSSVVLLRAGALRPSANGPAPRHISRGPSMATTTDLAYVVYTSGSTGQPKGVLIEHGALSNLVAWHCAAFGVTAADRCTQIASPGFDATVWEIWPCLAAGASLHIVPDQLRTDPLGLREWLVAKATTIAFLPTAVAEGIIGLTWPNRSALRYLLTGGDALSRRPPPDLPFTVVNNYGLSETTVVATSGVVQAHGDGPPSIGRPITGIITQVLDAELNLVTPGTPGELVISGVALARGYLHRPELDAERFIEWSGTRWYRTGDLVRTHEDGCLDFLGRLDDQLSIRGFRVEPGEVAAALNAHRAIAASVIMGLGTSSAERQLVAYVVPSGDERPDRHEINAFLHTTLPEYLLPTRYVWLDELPLTAHGKVDKAALRVPVETSKDSQAQAQERTATEATIAEVLSELLEVDDVGADENFFLLGGHSMLGAQLIVRLESLFGVEISLRYLFDHPTLSEIATGVERQLGASAQREEGL